MSTFTSKRIHVVLPFLTNAPKEIKYAKKSNIFEPTRFVEKKDKSTTNCTSQLPETQPTQKIEVFQQSPTEFTCYISFRVLYYQQRQRRLHRIYLFYRPQDCNNRVLHFLVCLCENKKTKNLGFFTGKNWNIFWAYFFALC